MKSTFLHTVLATTLFFCAAHRGGFAEEPMILLGKESEFPNFKPSSSEVTVDLSGEALKVAIEPGGGSPAIYLTPADGVPWNLEAFGHLEASVTNTGEHPAAVSLRVDNDGPHTEKPWNTESVIVKPGETAPLKVIFGHHYGYRPGYKLDSSAVSGLVIFTGKTDVPLSFQFNSITTGGEPGEVPPVDPRTKRIVPEDGFILGGDAKIDGATQLQASKGVSAIASDDAGRQVVEISLGTAPAERYLSIVPPAGAWDLGHSTELQVQIVNTGSAPISPTLQLANNGQDERTRVVALPSPLSPGDSARMVLPYAAEQTWIGPSGDLADATHRKGQPGTGTKFASDRVTKIILRFPGAEDGTSLRIDEIRGVVITDQTPEWLGKRPPVDGDWEITLDENFDGDSINDEIWDVTGPNYWGQKNLTHWSRDNVLVGDGVATIRLENRPGPHNDDPSIGHESEYAGGILRGFDKWSQRYGYFETRVKLPEEDGMWPAFWLMPDRGPEAGDQYKRQSTSKTGMEFDIMEHLTRWGPYRYTIAMHWDGYGKEHKATGSPIYFNPDSEGYVTAGLLWLPGQAIYYCNGKEVARWENDRISSEPSYILYTMPIGGWDNAQAPVDDQLPADFLIDYVRVWQRADLAE